MLALFLSIFIFFNILYLIGLTKKDFSIIDIGWGLSFLIIFIMGAISHSDQLSMRIYIIGFLVTIWSLRLSGYILYRSIKKNEEDFRYAAWRKEWGVNVNKITYMKVYMLQMVLSLVIASPLIFIFEFNSSTKFGNLLDMIGLGLWFVGFLFESIADYQKNRFKSKKSNRNLFCKTGLWGYSRHPNYFGETLLWWGIFLISINQVPIYYAVWGPLILNFLIIKVSGVAMLEESYKNREGFNSYKKTTNRFIPWIKQE